MPEISNTPLHPAQMYAVKRARPQEFTSVGPIHQPSGPMAQVSAPASAEPAPACDIPPVISPPTEEQERASKSHELKRFSLRGASAHLERVAADQKPLLDTILLSGQANAWYAPPNTGKSLIFLALLVQAIEQGRIEGDNVIYVNVDDTSRGLAEKVGLLEQFNVHTLGEGENKFTAGALIPALKKLVESGEAHGLFLVLDTLKKFVSIMDKKESASFATLCRQFVLKGGTLLVLGHTNKRPGNDGKLLYSGTSDIIDDFDCAYVISTRPEQPSETDKVVEFENLKRRGDVDARAVFSYTVREKISYEERLASVCKLDASGFLPVDQLIDTEREKAVIDAITTRISQGDVQKMQLARDVAASTGLGRHKVVRIIDQYTGSDRGLHRWTFVRGNRSTKNYRLLTDLPEVAGPD